jgi:hypothetical protein
MTQPDGLAGLLLLVLFVANPAPADDPLSDMPYRRAISTMGCPGLTLDEACALAQRHHLDGVELRSLGGTIDLPVHFSAIYGTPEKLAVRKPAVRCAEPGVGANVAPLPAAARRSARRCHAHRLVVVFPADGVSP